MFTMVLYGTHEQGLVMEPRFTEFPYETHEKGLHSTSCLKLEMHKLIGWWHNFQLCQRKKKYVTARVKILPETVQSSSFAAIVVFCIYMTRNS